jgi:hypothetical protein
VRELEQAVRRILLTGRYRPETVGQHGADLEERLVARLRERIGLDPRTSRKYVLSAKSG